MRGIWTDLACMVGCPIPEDRSYSTQLVTGDEYLLYMYDSRSVLHPDTWIE